MLGIICIFFPAIISVYMDSRLKNKIVDLNFFVYYYSLYLISLNFIIVSILILFFKNSNYILNLKSFTNLFAFKYFLISIVLSIILPFLFVVISKNISINIEWGNESKDSYEKNKK